MALRSPAAALGGPAGAAAASSESQERKRKPKRGWYAQQQAEKKALIESVQLLEARKAVLTNSVASNVVALANQQREADALRAALQKQQLAIAATQSAVMQYTTLTYRVNPIERYIELEPTWHDRIATLRALRPLALKDAERYMLARMKCFAANPVSSFSLSESFTASGGDECFAAFDMMPLEGITSVKQAFDALHNFLYNIEITWTERSSDLMVREGSCGYQNASNRSIDPEEMANEADMGATLHNFSIATTSGVLIESKSAMFSEYSPESDKAVICTNFVDHDSLSPYSPTRFRQDVSSAIVLRSYPVNNRKSAARRGGKSSSSSESMTSGSSSSEDESDGADSVVVMARYYFVRYPHEPGKQPPSRPLSLPAQASSVYDSEDPTFGFNDCFRIMVNAIYDTAQQQQQQQHAATYL